jgi:arsenite-transporting ATPase
LAELGIRNQRLVVNGVFQATQRNDPTALAFERVGIEALNVMPPALSALPQTPIGFHPTGFCGAGSLRALFDSHSGEIGAPVTSNDSLPACADLDLLIARIARHGAGVVMTMGKGGVGKTTLAARIATELASRGCAVHLSTTDPAAHVHDAVSSEMPNLEISRIDPIAETEAHIDWVMESAGANLDEEGRALLLEELRSPCTQEIAVFQAFAKLVSQGTDRFVVLDTAPTGHTLLLLDATEAYHREVLRSTSEIPEEVRTLLPRLRDPEFTKILLVTLPEPTPVHEAAQLQSDLKRAGIAPFAWVINQSFALANSGDPSLQIRAAHEHPFIREVIDQHATEVAILPWSEQNQNGRAQSKLANP